MSLFSCGFLRKSAATTAEVEEASKTRKLKEEAECAALQLLGRTPYLPTSDSSKKASRFSVTDGAQRVRLCRARKKKRTLQEVVSKAKETARQDDFEKETHYIDGRNRKRKRRYIRTREVTGIGESGRRKYSETEKTIIIREHSQLESKSFGRPTMQSVVEELHRKHPQMFGKGAPGLPNGIQRQVVRKIVERSKSEVITDDHGRPPSLR